MTSFSIALLVLLAVGVVATVAQALAAIRSAVAHEATAEALGTLADCKATEVELQAAEAVEAAGLASFPPGSPLARAVEESREVLSHATCARCGRTMFLCSCRPADAFSERERPTKPDND